MGVIHSRKTDRLVLIPQVQINMTHRPTIDRAIELLRVAGVHSVAHSVQEKMSHHKTSYHVGFGRTTLVKLAAETLSPYSVTKTEQWQLIREFCQLRIDRQGVTPSGTLRRGGPPGWAKPYTDRELEIGQQLLVLNGRASAIGAVPLPRRNPRPRQEVSL